MNHHTPPIGLRHAKTITVIPNLTVPGLPEVMGRFEGLPDVLATPYMICLVESACIEALQPFLNDGQMTVGTHVEISHVAATPVGMHVTAEVELVGQEGKRFRFKVECRDEREIIGRGFHERMLVSSEAFTRRLNGKTPP